jgi:acetyl-CoA C-acetyltransferase
MQNDGLWDVYNQFPMGNCGEHTATTHGITREDVDSHAIESYKRSADAWKRGAFDKEIAPVIIKDKKVSALSFRFLLYGSK